MNYSGFKAVIPNKFISKDGFSRYINLPDEQRLKIKKDDKVLNVTIKEIKAKCTKTQYTNGASSATTM